MAKVKLNCPKCGHELFVKTRAKIGEGTNRVVKMNDNRTEILEVLEMAFEPLSVGEVLARLRKKGVKRRRKKDGVRPSGSWDYHNVQVDLSLLVGNDLAKMSTGTETFNEHGVTVRPAPKYWV